LANIICCLKSKRPANFPHKLRDGGGIGDGNGQQRPQQTGAAPRWRAPIKGRKRKGNGISEDAFDLWLQRGLHQLYDDVAAEPIPDALLRLIEDDRTRRGK
jgi:hypothetical protein